MSQTPDAASVPPAPASTPPPVPPVPPAVPPPQPAAGPTPTGADAVQDFRNMAMLAHILNFTLIGPLIIYLVKKGQNAFLDTEAKEALNFSLTCAIAQFALIILHFLPFIWILIILLRPAIWIVQLVLGIMGGMKARDGVPYQYPVNLRLIK